MSLPSSTLSAIQKAGAAVFAADEKLKKSVKEYAERVSAAVAANPFDLGNDSLMEDWKTAARLSQTFAGIETDIKKAFQIAAELSGEDHPSFVPARAVKKVVGGQKSATVTAATAPARRTKPKSKPIKRAPAEPSDLTPTDVVIKPKKKTPKAKTSASKSTPSPIVAAAVKAVKAVKPVKTPKDASVTASSPAMNSNPAKLLAHLGNLLNTNEFTAFSQTAASKETGIPMGSMTAATKKLVDIGRIVAGPTGSFKLAEVQQPLVL